LIAFDLDYTLWDLWIDTHVSPPFTRDGNTINEVLDSLGNSVSFYPEVPEILCEVRKLGCQIALCSRTEATKEAKSVLQLLLISHPDEDEPMRAIDFFHQREIYPGSKTNHFKALHNKTGLPYTEMLFFDDEHRNKEVEKLGVTFVLVRNGMNKALLRSGLEQWRKNVKKILSDFGS